MISLGAIALAATVAAAPPASAAPQASVVRAAGGWRADITLDGPVLGWAVPQGEGGSRSLFVLVGPKPLAGQAPCGERGADAGEGKKTARLFRWSPAAPERLDLWASALVEGTLDAADLDGDGRDELILLRRGGIDHIGGESPGAVVIETLVTDRAIPSSCCAPRLAWDERAAADRGLRVGVLGALRTYRPGRGARASLVSEIGLPEHVSGGGNLVRVRSSPVRTIGRFPATGRLLLATEPEAMGLRRVRTQLLDPDGPIESQSIESWALLPGPERVMDSEFLFRDGAPVLVVTTTSGDKLSLLGEKSLRVYTLGGERTRAGEAPSYAATTGINLWQQAFPAILDLDRDGRDDLVLAYWKGLKNAVAALEVYRGDAVTGFAKPRSMTFDVEGGDKGFMGFGTDLDGDGLPDLLLRAGQELLVYPGAAPGRAIDNPVASKPSRRIGLPAGIPSSGGRELSMGTQGFAVSRTDGGAGTPHLVDLDGDGRVEAVFASVGRQADGRFVVVFVKGLAAPTNISTK